MADKKKRYYAKPCDPEFFNYELYYNEEDAINDHFWAGGNREFTDINKDLREDVVKDLEEIYEITIDSGEIDVTTVTFNGKPFYIFSDEDRYVIGKLAVELEEACSSSKQQNEIICRALELIYNEEFITGTIRGCSQGDWLEYICPKKMVKVLPYIEAVLFATGTEYMVTDEKFESEPDWDLVGSYGIYTEAWREEDIKADLAKQISSDCKPDDVVVLEEK